MRAMAKPKGRHRKQGGRTTPKGTRPPGPRHREFVDSGEPDLVRSIRGVIAAGLAPTLEAAATMVEAGTERQLDAITKRQRTDLGELLASFVEAPFQPMHVLARAMLPMLDDELLARRVANHLDAEGVRNPPPWLSSIDTPTVSGAIAMLDPFGDGDNIILGVEWPSGDEITAVIYIDHNLGTLVKDAFTVPDTFAATVAQFRELSTGDPTTYVDLTPADARAKITEAIERFDRTVPPPESDTWPAIRPLVDWLVRALPEGGEGYPFREWSDAQIDTIADRFIESGFAESMRAPRPAARSLVEPMLWFASGFVPGDPLRWTPVSVEIALTDWLPRKVLTGRDELRHVPEVMTALTRFAHAERGLDAALTNDVLASVSRWTPDFLEAIESPPRSPAQNAARLARLAAGFDPDEFESEWDGEFDDEWDDDPDDDLTASDMLDMLDVWEGRVVVEAGGPAAAARLDDRPLDDEPFDWSGIGDGDGVRDLVADALQRVDAACDALLDVEMRSICRRYLGEVVRADRRMFDRSARTDLLAGGIVWAAIDLQRTRDFGRDLLPLPTQKEVAAAMGVNAGSISQRSRSLLKTLSDRTTVLQEGPWHSAQRRWWMEQLDQIATYRAELTARLDADDDA